MDTRKLATNTSKVLIILRVFKLDADNKPLGFNKWNPLFYVFFLVIHLVNFLDMILDILRFIIKNLKKLYFDTIELNKMLWKDKQ